MYEKLVKRTLWIAQCLNDEFRREWSNDPPREVQCKICKTWVKPVETSYTGPEICDKNSMNS